MALLITTLLLSLFTGGSSSFELNPSTASGIGPRIDLCGLALATSALNIQDALAPVTSGPATWPAAVAFPLCACSDAYLDGKDD
jgi:hypothetical protein